MSEHIQYSARLKNGGRGALRKRKSEGFVEGISST
jgi:hypothetical protein